MRDHTEGTTSYKASHEEDQEGGDEEEVEAVDRNTKPYTCSHDNQADEAKHGHLGTGV